MSRESAVIRTHGILNLGFLPFIAAKRSTLSLPGIPMCEGIHAKLMEYSKREREWNLSSIGWDKIVGVAFFMRG